MASQVCLDASFALKLVLSEPGSEEVEAQWEAWLRGGVEVNPEELVLAVQPVQHGIEGKKVEILSLHAPFDADRPCWLYSTKTHI